MAYSKSKRESVEDYIEKILMLTQTNNQVRSIDLANALNYSKPSISIACKKMKEEGLIEISVEGYITLTPIGKGQAEAVYERHKIISDLLMSIGVSKENALQDACKIEHDLSEESFSKIKECYFKSKDAK